MEFDGPIEKILEHLMETGEWIVGTPDDLIQAIQHFDEVTGGFGGLMVTTVEWTSREKVWRSYELIADYVMPRFQGSLVALEDSNRRSRAVSQDLATARETSLERAYQSYERTHTS